MSNDYFQFKEFRIDQGACGMKVTTEACILGALVTPASENRIQSILDIGAGTGLLSLMLAQRFPETFITGVEIDRDAWNEASENVLSSPWNSSIEIINQTIQQYSNYSKKLFDLIISNPPFFKSHQKPVDYKKAHAIHADTLSLEDLAYSVLQLLNSSGEFHVLLPEYEAGLLQQILLQNQLYLNQSIKVFNNTKSQSVFRVINSYSRIENKSQVKSFFIRNEHNDYTDEFISRLSPYYLHL